MYCINSCLKAKEIFVKFIHMPSLYLVPNCVKPACTECFKNVITPPELLLLGRGLLLEIGDNDLHYVTGVEVCSGSENADQICPPLRLQGRGRLPALSVHNCQLHVQA